MKDSGEYNKFEKLVFTLGTYIEHQLDLRVLGRKLDMGVFFDRHPAIIPSLETAEHFIYGNISKDEWEACDYLGNVFACHHALIRRGKYKITGYDDEGTPTGYQNCHWQLVRTAAREYYIARMKIIRWRYRALGLEWEWNNRANRT